MAGTQVFTSESVSEGHPDKIADQISDAVLDALLAQDKHARVACETLIKNGMVMIAGEISTSAWVDIDQIARGVIRNIGYNNPHYGFDADTCAIVSTIGKQSPDIAIGVDREDKELGAGDQGMMFGFATNETPELMPAPIMFAHKLVKKQSEVRKSRELTWLRPDAKSQISLRYENQKPVAVDCVVLSTQHDPDIEQKTLQEAVMETIIKPVIPQHLLHRDTRYFINPTGRFVIGGPVSDCGLTGRKIIVDTYGGMSRHGGGCFSGKDPSKVDRSGAYAARHVAKNIVAAGLADRCEVQISYAIGIPEPTSILVETFGTNKIPENKIIELIQKHFDLRPRAMIEKLHLLNPIYLKTAAYGHFGRENLNFGWEKTDKKDILADALERNLRVVK